MVMAAMLDFENVTGNGNLIEI